MAKQDEDLEQNLTTTASPEEVKELQGEDTQAGASEEHDDAEEDEATSQVRRDTEIEQAATDEERERIRERRRQERKDRKTREREKFDSLRRQVETLLSKNQQLEQTVAGIQNTNLGQSIATIDTEITNANNMMARLRVVEAEAITKQDGKTAAEARDRQQFLRDRVNQLTYVKGQATQNQNRAAPADPVVAMRATQFMNKHAWYGGVQSSESDSRVLTTLDHQLSQDGWDPKTDAYWEELESRMAKYLPHRAAQQGNQSQPRKPNGNAGVAGSATGSGTSSQGNGQSAGYVVSAERVRAMKDAGIWDDPERRKAAIKRYREYDEVNARR